MPKSLTVFIPEDLHVALKMASARVKQTVKEFVADAIKSKIASLPAGVIKDGKSEEQSNISQQKQSPQKSSKPSKTR